MKKFIKEKTFIENLFVIRPLVFKDNRGFFYESYNKKDKAITKYRIWKIFIKTDRKKLKEIK